MAGQLGSLAYQKLGPDLQKRFKTVSTEQGIVDLMTEFISAAKEVKKKELGWGSSNYGVSKLGVIALTRIQGQDIIKDSGREDILINCCCPGNVATDMSSHKGPLTIDQGAVTPVYLALLPGGCSHQGLFFYQKAVKDFWGPVSQNQLLNSDDKFALSQSDAMIPVAYNNHSSVGCQLNIKKPDPMKIDISFRKLKDIDIQAFREDILDSELYRSPASGLDQQAVQYNRVLQALLDKHAPLITRCVTARPHSRWFTDDLRKSKQRVRQLERKYRLSRAEIDRQILKDECRLYSNRLAMAKREYYSEQLDECDTHQLFQRVDRLSSTSTRMVLPSDDDPRLSLADRFCNFFSTKIDVLVRSLESLPSNLDSKTQPWNGFDPTSLTELSLFLLATVSHMSALRTSEYPKDLLSVR
eukprot:XP_011668723.1 PREDICTED: uncharacterized protein LOC105440375 [Strongylocentrotus purpuratus]